jgi:hypothetical protein
MLPQQAWRDLYKWQWLYLPFLYGFLAFKVRITDVTDTWLAKTSGPIRVNFYDSVLVRIFLVKGLWAAWRLYWPLAVLGVPQTLFWPLFFATEMSSGFWLAWNFEVSHLAPDADFPGIVEVPVQPNGPSSDASALALAEAKRYEAAAAAAAAKAAGSKKGPAAAGPAAEDPSAVSKTPRNADKPAAAAGGAAVQRVIPRSWAAVQAESSVDYGHNSWWTAFWCGALNYQIEHHLFPGISQYHYPAIAPIVQSTCKEFGVRYNYEPGFLAAWRSHIKLLYDMGQKGQAYHMD